MTQLTQAQNEALVKLMLVARYQDKKLSLSEEETFNNLLNSLEWESGVDAEIYARREIAAVRKALSGEESTTKFINTQCAVLQNPEAKTQCVAILEQVLAADGINAQESTFLAQIKAALQ